MNKSFAKARTCYQHLAGDLGIQICDALIKIGCVHHNIIDGHSQYKLSDIGVTWTKDVGFYQTKRTQIKACIDVTHKRPHLAGAWAIELCAFLLRNGYTEQDLKTRHIKVTALGEQFLQQKLAINWAQITK
ncbi:hypothetical protein F9L33_10325 [Amylibacter sp. SFDW26]|uniref:hypothetical protein n=1 Tax=Amylibacter sp. SFDW26 TaxID=2652722 RepID=UPI00126155E2|nr:hypothetical protein [Amylibacter sp. SFDW26]KAB7613758.1 hypothetical protein F9L33_10325 [Amylibacter sp. SFDW26]